MQWWVEIQQYTKMSKKVGERTDTQGRFWITYAMKKVLRPNIVSFAYCQDFIEGLIRTKFTFCVGIFFFPSFYSFLLVILNPWKKCMDFQLESVFSSFFLRYVVEITVDSLSFMLYKVLSLASLKNCVGSICYNIQTAKVSDVCCIFELHVWRLSLKQKESFSSAL